MYHCWQFRFAWLKLEVRKIRNNMKIWQNMNDEIINMENDGEMPRSLCDENDKVTARH